MVLVLLLLLLCCLLLKLSAVHHIRLPLKSLLVVLALSEMRSTATAKLLVLELPLLNFHVTPLALNNKSFVNKLLVVIKSMRK
jgi:hypothetical protein